MNKIAAILINFNDKEEYLSISYDYLIHSPRIFSVIIVDNGSSHENLQKTRKLSKKSGKSILIENGINLGFARAANIGVRKALKLGATHILILNPDLILQDRFEDSLLRNKSDLVQITIKSYINGAWIYDFGGKINWFLGRTYHLVNNQPENPNVTIKPDYVSGGASLINSKVFKKIGLFDEGYFMYFEDADFSLRARKAGFVLDVESGTVLEHKLENIKLSHNINKMKYNLTSNFYFVVKWVPWYFKPFAFVYLLWLWCKIYV